MSAESINVLLVEDDDLYAHILRGALAKSTPKVAVERRRTLGDATALVSTTRFDAVLLDLNLPDSSGLETIGRMLAAAPGIPIVVLTATAESDLAVSAVQHGAQDYLVKSETDSKYLSRALRYAIERASVQAKLLETEAKLRQAHKMEAVGRLAGGIAHDFNNVLTAIYGYADLLLEEFVAGDPRRSDVEEIRRMAERAATLTRQLLAFSRQQMLQPQVLDLNRVIHDVQRMLGRMIGTDIQLTFEPSLDLWAVRADRGQIEQVLMNLGGNARDAMPEGGSVTIRTANRIVEPAESAALDGLPAGPYVVMSVEDTGIGMPEQVRRHIFEPFFTTKAQGEGTGLGLATIYGIVKQSGGGIFVESEENKGTTFSIYLPPHLAVTSSP
jgi:two-component system, cell cycle sensor histidine kinase and response regulator CckA